MLDGSRRTLHYVPLVRREGAFINPMPDKGPGSKGGAKKPKGGGKAAGKNGKK
jgi:hypothetical protein